MNKKMMLMVAVLGFSSVAYSSDVQPVPTEKLVEGTAQVAPKLAEGAAQVAPKLAEGAAQVATPKLAERVAKFLKSVPKYTIFLPSTLLKLSVARWKDMAFWKSATFDVVVWAVLAFAIKIAIDKNQERKKRSQVNKDLQEVLEAYDAQEDELEVRPATSNEDIEA